MRIAASDRRAMYFAYFLYCLKVYQLSSFYSSLLYKAFLFND